MSRMPGKHCWRLSVRFLKPIDFLFHFVPVIGSLEGIALHIQNLSELGLVKFLVYSPCFKERFMIPVLGYDTVLNDKDAVCF